MEKQPNKTKFIVLGGLGEIGKNMYCLMHEDEIIILDSGIKFPGDDLLGIDYVIPDFTFLKENESKIKALIVTHGHEDHIGSVPYLVNAVNIPTIYAPNQAKELMAIKLADRNIRYDNLEVYDENTKLKFKHFEIDFFLVTHSIPDSHGISIKTPNGRVVTTGDYKFDFTPIGPMASLHKMSQLGEDGVDLLIGESTNALTPGFSISESVVDNALSDIFASNKQSRLIVATFASNIYRLKHIVETCYKHNRKICVFGRSMENNINISIKGGYIDHKELFITPAEANNLKPGEVTLLCTGSQGEPLAALSRIANGTHRQIKLRDDDIVIFSSNPIPGNGPSVARTINKLYIRGVKVFTNTSDPGLHTSGHGNAEEIKLMLRLMKPKNLIPFHGEYRMLKKHADLAVDCGVPKDNIFIQKNGDVLTLHNGKVAFEGETVPGEDIYVDGSRIGEVGSAVLRDRNIMAQEGVLAVIANIDFSKKKLLIKPNITTRGFVLVNESTELIKTIEKIVTKTINEKLLTTENPNEIRSAIISDLVPFINEENGRNPMILPVILDVRK